VLASVTPIEAERKLSPQIKLFAEPKVEADGTVSVFADGGPEDTDPAGNSDLID
jgi:hypothetical protein